jgi:hypothetical protein
VDFTIAFLVVTGITVAVCLWPPSPTRLTTMVVVLSAGTIVIVTVLALAVLALAAAVIAITLALGAAVLLAAGLPIPPAVKPLLERVLERVKTYLPTRSLYEG